MALAGRVHCFGLSPVYMLCEEVGVAGAFTIFVHVVYTRCCEISNVVCDWARSFVLLLRDSGVAGRVHFPCHVNILLFATFTVH